MTCVLFAVVVCDAWPVFRVVNARRVVAAQPL